MHASHLSVLFRPPAGPHSTFDDLGTWRRRGMLAIGCRRAFLHRARPGNKPCPGPAPSSGDEAAAGQEVHDFTWGPPTRYQAAVRRLARDSGMYMREVRSAGVALVWMYCVDGPGVRVAHKAPATKGQNCAPRKPLAESHGQGVCTLLCPGRR
ncbi:hypothetical protein CGMCC3_g17104 [Colletotrichum fructicola]|nr:uncharacterized protein CGMCC3_g17104 [Colletotrichum fructicola]KAE9566752.1 hypothetical protein CGMCC3_g17104 [Colletotrichum fructicola]